MSIPMQLRDAQLSDLDLLQYWDDKPHVVAAMGEDEGWDWPAELGRRADWLDMLIAEEDGRPIGFIQIIDPASEETHYWGDVGSGLRAIDIWIGEETDLGRGFGTRMMQSALERCFADISVTAVLLDPSVSNHGAHRFYERLGFERMERRRFDKEDCYVYRLERIRWEQAKTSTSSAKP